MKDKFSDLSTFAKYIDWRLAGEAGIFYQGIGLS